MSDEKDEIKRLTEENEKLTAQVAFWMRERDKKHAELVREWERCNHLQARAEDAEKERDELSEGLKRSYHVTTVVACSRFSTRQPDTKEFLDDLREQTVKAQMWCVDHGATEAPNSDVERSCSTCAYRDAYDCMNEKDGDCVPFDFELWEPKR